MICGVLAVVQGRVGWWRIEKTFLVVPLAAPGPPRRYPTDPSFPCHIDNMDSSSSSMEGASKALCDAGCLLPSHSK